MDLHANAALSLKKRGRLDEVRALVGNPATYPEWWPVAVEIRGERWRWE
jgi:hypothetical protein